MRSPDNMNSISARRTDLLDDDEEGDLYKVPKLSESEWYPDATPPYQDDVNIDPDALDPVMAEQADDPTALFNVSPLAFGRELARTAFDEGWDTERDDGSGNIYNMDDYRERIEDRDEDSDNAASAA